MGLASAADADDYTQTQTSYTSTGSMATDTHENIEANINNEDTYTLKKCNVPLTNENNNIKSQNNSLNNQEQNNNFETDTTLLQKKSSEKVKTESNENVTTITEDNYNDYLSISSSGKATLNRNYFVAGKNYTINFTYFPSDANKFEVNFYSNSYKNDNLKIIGNGITIKDTNFIINKNNFNSIVLEDMVLDYSPDYMGDYVNISSATLNNVTINVDTQREIFSIPLTVSGEKSLVENCTVNANVPSTQIDWYTPNIPRMPKGVGVWITSNNVTLANNVINVNESKVETGNESYYRSLYGIYSSGSYTTLRNNTFLLNGTQYSYGIVVRSLNNLICDNNITVVSEYYAAGINVEGEGISNNLMCNNFINVSAGFGVTDQGNPDVAYACLILDFSCGGENYVASYRSMCNNSYINNTVICDGRQVYGFELWGGVNTTISGNNLTVTGTLPLGIGAIGINTTMENNIIFAEGTSNSTEFSADYIKPRTAGIYVFGMKEGNTIKNNTIAVINGRALRFESAKNMLVENNFLLSEDYAYVIEVDNINNTFKYNAIIGEGTTDEVIKDTTDNQNIYINNREPTLSTLTITAPDDILLDEEINITVTLRDEEDNFIPNQYITVQVGDDVQTLLTDDEGKCVIPFSSNTPQTIQITAEYKCYNDYGSSATKQLTVSELITGQLVLTGVESPHIGDTLTLNVTFELDKPADVNVNITYELPGQEPITLQAVDNSTSLTTTITNDYLSGGIEQNIIITAIADKYNVEITGINTTLGVQKAITNITITPTTAQAKQETTITAIITTPTQLTINEGTVTFTDNNGEVIGTVIVTNNQASIQTTFNASGNNSITASYDGTAYYEECNVSQVIVVSKIDTSLHVEGIALASYGDTILFKGNLTDANGNPLSDKSLIIHYDDNIQVITNANGIFQYNVTALTVGTNTVTVTFNGDAIYGQSNTSTTFTIKTKDTIISIDEIGQLVYMDTYLLKGKILTVEGIPVSNVIIKVNGVAIENVTDNEGIFSVGLVADSVGTNSVSVAFDGNENYSASGNSTTFTVVPMNTCIILDNITSTCYNDNVTVSGKLITTGNITISDASIDVTINGVKSKVKTGTNGVFTVTVLADTVGTNNVTLSFAGTDIYAASSNSTVFAVVPADTLLSLDNIGTACYSDNITVSGNLVTLTGTCVADANIDVFVNGVKSTVTTGTNGVFTVTVLADTVGTNNVTLSFAGTDIYAASSNSTVFAVVPADTLITINPIVDAQTNTDITISGTLTKANGQTLPATNVSLTVNGYESQVETDSNGIYTYTYNATKSGTSTVTVGYAGNEYYNSYTTTLKFNVTGKENVVVTIDPISNTQTNSNITITGKFMKVYGPVLSNSNVKLTINGVTTYVKTDSKGVYTYTYNATKSGTNTVTAGYGGSGNYNPYSTTTTFNATGKENVVVTVDPIGNVETNSIITITGTFKRASGSVLANSNVRLNINGATYYAKTNSKGVYTFTYNVTKSGINTLVAGYGGSGNYNPYSTTTTFNATGKENVVVTVDPIGNVETNSIITITGTFKRASGSVLANSNVRLNINGATYYAKTNSKGVYTFTYNVTKSGINTLVAGYGGSGNYNPYSTTTTFNATGKENVVVTVDPIGNVETNSIITITGTFKRASGSVLANSNVRLNINGATYYAKTNSKGVYTFTYNVTKSGINTLVAGYGGSGNYNPYSTTVKFNATGKENVIVTIDPIGNTKKNTNVTISGTFKRACGNVLANSKVKLTVNGVTTYVKTNSKGVYTYTYNATKSGTNTVTAGYGGSNNYNSYTTTTKFNVV